MSCLEVKVVEEMVWDVDPMAVVWGVDPTAVVWGVDEEMGGVVWVLGE